MLRLWRSYRGTLHISTIRIQTSTPDWRCVCVCASVSKISPDLPPKSTKGWGMTSSLRHDNHTLLALDARESLVYFFFPRLHTASAETNSAILALVPLDPVLVKRRRMSCGGQNKLGDLSFSSIYPLVFVCFACLRVTYLRTSVLISEKCLHPDVTLMETWQEAHLATLDPHYAGFAWTLTSNSLSPFQMKTHTHTHRLMHVKHTLKKNKH